MSVADIRSWLPRVIDNDPYPLRQAKDSLTIHYQGMEIARDLSDEAAQELVMADAREHVRRDWGHGQRGGGVMYHEMIAPSGTVFLTRDPDDYLWHCGNDVGNRTSRAIQVMCGPNTPPTTIQLAVLEERIAVHQLPIKAHKDWSATQCPGNALYHYLQSRGLEVVSPYISRAEFDAYRKNVNDTIEAMKAAYNPLLVRSG